MRMIDELLQGGFDDRLREVYPGLEPAKNRCQQAIAMFTGLFGEREGMMVLSAPGRTEIGGNHTDHNNGRVLAGAVSLDMIAVATAADDGQVELLSEGFPMLRMSLNDLTPHPDEIGTSAALVRGIAAAMQDAGYRTGGFYAYVTSDVLKGSGLSSSAAFEVLTACIFDHLYNEGRLSPTRAAIMSQYAENVYFGKPCGLMDQMASATGGFVAIDFQDNGNPIVEAIPFDLSKTGHTLCIVDTKADHQDLTAAYAAIPEEMRRVAGFFGKSVLREVPPEEIVKNAAALREACGDRAFLRAMHFMAENDRAAQQAQALKAGEFSRFLELMNESGRSSYQYLQNISVEGAVEEQPMAAALCMSEYLLMGRGATRVHGGGFAGTIQAIVPDEGLPAYRAGMESLFGPGSCYTLSIRKQGGIRLL